MNNGFEAEDNLQYSIDAELQKFNWGAFFLNFIWATFNGAWKEFWPVFLIMIVVCFLSYIPILGFLFAILNIILAIYVGKHANSWAWYGKKWESLDKFVSVQKVWGISSPFVFLILWFCVPIIIMVASAYFFIPYVKEMAANAEPISKTAVSHIVKAPNYREFVSGKDIANYLTDQHIYIKSIENNKSVVAEVKGPYQAILTFEKDGACSLEQKNCYISYSIKVNDELKPPIHKTYFDDKGEVQMEKL